MLEITDLKTYYDGDVGTVHAVDGVDLTLRENEIVGLLGESGCGKTTLAKSIIRLLPKEGTIVGGSISYNGTEITDLTHQQLRTQIRWKEISMIPQNAMNGFDPVYTIGDQIVEVIQAHRNGVSNADALDRGQELFEQLGIDPERIHDYPHQLSGGMAQRAMIALSLALSPAVILADEPTTGLDMIIQRRILHLLEDLKTELDVSILMVTHDISAAVEVCDRIAVMYGGRIVEIGETETILEDPRHPYTLGLRNAFPDIHEDSEELVSIPGQPFDAVDPPQQCRFAERCPFAESECWETLPDPREYDGGQLVECLRADEKEYLQREGGKRETWLEQADAAEHTVEDPQ